MSLTSYSQENPFATDSSPLLSSQERRQMLEDIGRIGLTLGREIRAGSARQAEPPVPLSPSAAPFASAAFSPLERLAMLFRLWPAIQTAFCALAQQADTRSRQETASIPLPRLRGGPATVQRLARAPQSMTAWQTSKYLQRNSHHAPPYEVAIPESRTCRTTDTRANRFVVSLLLAVEQELRSLTALAAFCGEDSAAAQALATAAAARRGRSSASLRDVGPLDSSERRALWQGDDALRCSPPYQALSDISRKLFAPLHFDWTECPLLRLPSLESWHLYEIWCFFQVAGALQANGWQALEGDVIRWQPEGLRLALQTGKASRLRFVSPPEQDRSETASLKGKEKFSRSDNSKSPSLELFYQPLFPSANQTAQRLAMRRLPLESLPRDPSTLSLRDFSSRSHAMQPDIALLRQGRLFLLDPKFRGYEADTEDRVMPSEADIYRQNASLLIDIDKMHAYRDAIRHNGRQAVAEAWCLFPGTSESSAALIAYPSKDMQEPFGKAGVGALRLRPGSDPSTLLELLRRWLAC